MSNTAVKDEAMRLAPEDRAELADLLMNSLDPIGPDVEAAWSSENRQRIEAYSLGKIPTEDGDDVMRRLRDRLR